jgi:hypothetical protein
MELDAPKPRLQPGEFGRDRRRRTVLLLRDQLVDDQFIVTCPYCGEQVEIYLEPDVRGAFVQDCEVCCNPWRVRVFRSGSDRDVEVRRADGSE